MVIDDSINLLLSLDSCFFLDNKKFKMHIEQFT